MGKVTLEEYMERNYGVKPRELTEAEIEIIRKNHKRILQMSEEERAACFRGTIEENKNQ